ncbi:MAG: hypothetical protein ACREU9_04535 [Gammaproteobacteria bacterium]
MKQSRFPAGWDEERVRRVLAHYEKQSEDEAVAEDEAAVEDPTQTLMEVPREPGPIESSLFWGGAHATITWSFSSRLPSGWERRRFY